MKSNSSLLPRAAQTLRRLTFALLGSSALLAQAANPTLTGTSSSISIDDETTSALTTNIVSVQIDFWPTNVGGFASLPSGVTLDASGTNIIITTTNDATATTLLNQLVFTPIANVIKVPTSSNVVFHAQVLDAAGNTSTLRTTTLSITATNNAPTFTVSGTFNITDKQTNTQPFQNVFISDVDDRGLQTNFITVTLANTNSGYFTVGSSGFSSNLVGSTFVYSYTNIIAQITNAIKNLTFIPNDNYLPVGQTDTNVFTLCVSDNYAVVTNSSVRILVYSTNDVPNLTGVDTNAVFVATGQTISPFAVMTLLDVDQNDTITNNGQDLSWRVTLSGPAPLGALYSGGSPVGTTFGGTNDPAAATAILRNLSYVAPNQQISGTNSLTLLITANDGHGGTFSTNIYLKLYSIVLPPGLSGTQPGQTVYDNSSLTPFSKVGIQSFNGSFVTLRIQLSGVTNDAVGVFINLNNFTRTIIPGAGSLYSFTGTSEAATTAR